MNRPDNIQSYEELDLKLGIKSSLPHVKSTIALLILLWECCNRPAKLAYSKQLENKIVLANDVEELVLDSLSKYCTDLKIKTDELKNTINDNQIFKSQLEALIVAFELVWKIAKVDFVDSSLPASKERTGGIRYPKVLCFTSNMDIIHCLIERDYYRYMHVLLRWIGCDLPMIAQYEVNLLRLLTVISEGALFKLVDGSYNIIFNQNSIYKKILSTNGIVDISGDEEAKGSLRILKSLLMDDMNPYLDYGKGGVSSKYSDEYPLSEYQKRVEQYLRLSATKVVGPEYSDSEMENDDEEQGAENATSSEPKTGGTNVLYYGVPGSGKSYTVDKFCKDNLSDNQYMRRVVFHPDYTYSDFVGQILPILELDEADNTEKLRYMFTPGPFTKILKIAYENPTENCVLVIEELNRGNAPAIFGEIFQLLDREEDVTSPIFGRSKYGINNTDIANEVFGNKNKLIYLPSNLSIIATMNTSDQNVFTLDTAFQRRWEMEYIPNVFEGAHADTKIVGSNITWKAFAETVNDIISRNSFNMGSTEDKGLGAYFAIGKDLEDKKGFAEKVLKYLWDDAVKLDRKRLFNADLFSLPSMFNAFNNGGLEAVLQSTVYERMLNESKAVVEPASDSVDEISDETGENV